MLFKIWAGTHHFLQDCMCAQQRVGSACTFAQAHQSLRFWSLATTKRPAKTMINLHGCAGWSESSLGTHAILKEMLITKTCLYNFDPLKPHFYTVKLGFTGYTLFFLFLLKNIDCRYSLEPPRRGGSNEYRQSMFWAEIWKNQRFFIGKFSVFGGEIFYIFE